MNDLILGLLFIVWGLGFIIILLVGAGIGSATIGKALARFHQTRTDFIDKIIVFFGYFVLGFFLYSFFEFLVFFLLINLMTHLSPSNSFLSTKNDSESILELISIFLLITPFFGGLIFGFVYPNKVRFPC